MNEDFAKKIDLISVYLANKKLPKMYLWRHILKKIAASIIDYESKSAQKGGIGQSLTTGRSPQNFNRMKWFNERRN